MLQQVERFVGRFRGITPTRVKNSLRARTMRALGRIGAVRSIASYGYTPKAGVESRLFPEVDVDRVLDGVRREGIWRGLVLPGPIVAELLDFAKRAAVYGNRNTAWGFAWNQRREAEAQVGARFTVGGYYNTYDACPAVREVANDPLLREVALRYVGPRAQHLGTNMWWSYSNDLTAADRNAWAQQFHFDLDDYKFIKFFFYLTDVDAETGPHVYVTGTHTHKLLRHVYPMRRLPDADVEAAYGRDRVLVLTGRAGEGFVEDTFGLHKGEPPRSKDRLILQFEYAISQGYTDDRCDPASLQRLAL